MPHGFSRKLRSKVVWTVVWYTAVRHDEANEETWNSEVNLDWTEVTIVMWICWFTKQMSCVSSLLSLCYSLSKQCDDNARDETTYHLSVLVKFCVKIAYYLVVVLSECLNGRWGLNCENICRCEHRECDHVIGCTSCTEYPGWTGANCDEDIDECLSPSYCSDRSDCENINGSAICHCHSWYSMVNNQCECKYWNTFLQCCLWKTKCYTLAVCFSLVLISFFCCVFIMLLYIPSLLNRFPMANVT